jgi:peptide/nickel transport system permease protein
MPESGLAVRGDGAPAAGTADSRAAGGARVDRRWRRVLRNGRLVLGGTVVTVFLVLTLLAPWIAPRDPLARDLQNTLKAPSREFLLGTDELGRDLLSRLLHGARITLGISVVALLVSAMVGLALGTSAGYVRRLGPRRHAPHRRPALLPGIILAIAVIAVMGRGSLGPAVALSIFPIPAFCPPGPRRHHGGERAGVRAGRPRTRRAPSPDPPAAHPAEHHGPHSRPGEPQHREHHPGRIVVGFLGSGAQPPEPEWG